MIEEEERTREHLGGRARYSTQRPLDDEDSEEIDAGICLDLLD